MTQDTVRVCSWTDSYGNSYDSYRCSRHDHFMDRGPSVAGVPCEICVEEELAQEEERMSKNKKRRDDWRPTPMRPSAWNDNDGYEQPFAQDVIDGVKKLLSDKDQYADLTNYTARGTLTKPKGKGKRKERSMTNEQAIEVRRPVAVCHDGTGTGTVARMLADRGVELRVARTREQATYANFDYLILLGGADIHPFWYGEDVTYASGFDRTRDIIEYTLLKRALTKRVPIMGICRGHQMITAVMGGTLYQDLDRDGLVTGHPGFHGLSWVDPMLAAYMPSANVNSYHHQAVKDVPHGFETLAVSDDGVIESIWRPGILGIQWHPELMVNFRPEWAMIMDWFVAGLQEPAAVEIPAKKSFAEIVAVEEALAAEAAADGFGDWVPEGEVIDG